MNKHDTVVHEYWLRTIESEYSDDLNEWEGDFVATIRMKLRHKSPLSDKQEQTLERLYEKATR